MRWRECNFGSVYDGLDIRKTQPASAAVDACRGMRPAIRRKMCRNFQFEFAQSHGRSASTDAPDKFGESRQQRCLKTTESSIVTEAAASGVDMIGMRKAHIG